MLNTSYVLFTCDVLTKNCSWCRKLPRRIAAAVSWRTANVGAGAAAAVEGYHSYWASSLSVWYGGGRVVGWILQLSGELESTAAEDPHLQNHRDRGFGRREDLPHVPLLCRQVPGEDRGHDRGGLPGEAGRNWRRENQGVHCRQGHCWHPQQPAEEADLVSFDLRCTVEVQGHL